MKTGAITNFLTRSLTAFLAVVVRHIVLPVFLSPSLLLFPFHYSCSSSSPHSPLYLSRIWRSAASNSRIYSLTRSTSHGVCAGLKFHRGLKISLDRLLLLLLLFRTTWTSSAFVPHILRLLTLVQIVRIAYMICELTLERDRISFYRESNFIQLNLMRFFNAIRIQMN